MIQEIRHFHLFCGLGGGAKGFNQGEARVGNMVAIDVDAAAIRDFGKLAGVERPHIVPKRIADCGREII